MDTTDATKIIGYCLNCGDKAYEHDGRAARHFGTHKIVCIDPLYGPMGTCAALSDD